MANAKRCDRCGGYYDSNEAHKSGVRIGEHMNGMQITYGPGYQRERHYDLCDRCLSELMDFLGEDGGTVG